MMTKVLFSAMTTYLMLQASDLYAVGRDVSLAAECENVPPDQQTISAVDQSLVGNGPSAMCLDKAATLPGLSIEHVNVSHEGLRSGAWVIVTFAENDSHALEVFEKAHLLHTVAILVREKVVFRGLLTESRGDASLRIRAGTDEEAQAIRDRLSHD